MKVIWGLAARKMVVAHPVAAAAPPAQGAPVWGFNMTSMNMYLGDTPLWYTSGILAMVHYTPDGNGGFTSDKYFLSL
jgi:hypothetical protein